MTAMWRRVLTAAVAATAILAGSACGPIDERSVRIAVVGEFTGADASADLAPVRWAVEDVRAAGGLVGTAVELVPFDLAERTLDDTITAIRADRRVAAVVGPWRSSSALAVDALLADGIVVVSPAATAAEVARAHATSPMFFRTAPGDEFQVRALLDRAEAAGARRLSLLASFGPYGDTFLRFLGAEAAERGMSLESAVRFPIDGDGCESEVARTASSEPDLVVVAVSHEPTAACIVRDWRDRGSPGRLLFTDRSMSSTLARDLGPLAEGLEGVASAPDPGGGFGAAYRHRFAATPPGFAANAYDAALLVALGLDHTGGTGGVALAAAIARLTSDTGTRAEHTRTGLGAARAALADGGAVWLAGAGGSLRYVGDGQVTLAQAFYRHWRIEAGDFTTLGHVVIDGASGVGTTSGDDGPRRARPPGPTTVGTDAGQPSGGGTLAVLVAASSGWANYRHQADTLAVYQLLRRNGVLDDRIVLILADDLANDPRNPTPGQVRQHPDGPDLRSGAQVDLLLDQVDATALATILRGGATPTGVSPLVRSPDDHLLVFVAGHGNHDGILVGAAGAEPTVGPRTSMLTPVMLDGALRELASADGFARALVVVEACMSGVFADTIDAPGVITIASASATEASLSTNRDPRSGTWLADEMTAHLLDIATADPDASLDQVFATLYERVEGSHVEVSARGVVARPGSGRVGDYLGR
jgi:ABC-type branched-subunit amino acid transport system substrate-binding protein/glycosylphosphatidylinositol transamidase (GPIT) subunit GPI8